MQKLYEKYFRKTDANTSEQLPKEDNIVGKKSAAQLPAPKDLLAQIVTADLQITTNRPKDLDLDSPDLPHISRPPSPIGGLDEPEEIGHAHISDSREAKNKTAATRQKASRPSPIEIEPRSAFAGVMETIDNQAPSPSETTPSSGHGLSSLAPVIRPNEEMLFAELAETEQHLKAIGTQPSLAYYEKLFTTAQLGISYYSKDEEHLIEDFIAETDRIGGWLNMYQRQQKHELREETKQTATKTAEKDSFQSSYSQIAASVVGSASTKSAGEQHADQDKDDWDLSPAPQARATATVEKYSLSDDDTPTPAAKEDGNLTEPETSSPRPG